MTTKKKMINKMVSGVVLLFAIVLSFIAGILIDRKWTIEFFKDKVNMVPECNWYSSWSNYESGISLALFRLRHGYFQDSSGEWFHDPNMMSNIEKIRHYREKAKHEQRMNEFGVGVKELKDGE